VNKLFNWLKVHRELVLYIIFGVATTLVNYLVYFPLYNWFGLSGALSNALSWVVAVAFANLTNKPFVFQSNDWSAKTVFRELLKFVGCRVGSGAIETFLIFLTVDCLHWNGNVLKILTSVIVVILNYIASKWLVFRKEEKR
jgi:putative flippase GtrA